MSCANKSQKMWQRIIYSLSNVTKFDEKIDIKESLQQQNFAATNIVRHGLPYSPSTLAYDPVQNLLAIGTRTGAIRIYGKSGVECYLLHESDIPINQLLFMINEGALISVSDKSVHLWNLRQQRPAILHSLSFKREQVTYCYLPFKSKWLYIGTEQGNTFIANVETFELAGYNIYWNKAVALDQKSHPGKVKYIGEKPDDNNKLLIGFETGLLTLWDLKSHTANCRIRCPLAITSVSWHYDGKNFICSHSSGTLTTWNIGKTNKPIQTQVPHGQVRNWSKADRHEQCTIINKVQWLQSKGSESFVVFSGGVTADRANRNQCFTIMQGKEMTLFEMEEDIVSFSCLYSNPWPNDFEEPFAVAVLLENGLAIYDLSSPNFPPFEIPYTINIHESPVTCIQYYSECPVDLFTYLYTLGKRHRKTGINYSESEWPLKGGTWGDTKKETSLDLVITGHSDGSIRFWDASAIAFQLMYKFTTTKIFDRGRVKEGYEALDPPYAIQNIILCMNSRTLIVAGSAGFVILHKFSVKETNTEIATIDVTIADQTSDTSSDCQFNFKSDIDDNSSVYLAKLKSNPLRQSSGFQADLICRSVYSNGDPESSHNNSILSLCFSSGFGILVFSNCKGLAIIDTVQKHCVMSVRTIDVYALADNSQFSKLSKSKLHDVFDPSDPDSPTYVSNFSRSDESPPASAGLPNGVSSPNQSRNAKWSYGSKKISRTSTNPSVETDTEDSSLRSRSPSLCSVDKEGNYKETIRYLALNETYARKGDATTTASLWIGTSLGSVLVIVLNLPPMGKERTHQPVLISSGTVLRDKNKTISIDILDNNGNLLEARTDYWKDEKRLLKKHVSSSHSTSDNDDKHYGIMCTENQVKIMKLPQYTIVGKSKSLEGITILKSAMVLVHVGKNVEACLACLTSAGTIQVYGIPSLRKIMEEKCFRNVDERVIKTFSWNKNGQAIYMPSPTEVQKLTIIQNEWIKTGSYLGNPFNVKEMPEKPKKGFMSIFTQSNPELERKKLFGTADGRLTKTVAKKILGVGNTDSIRESRDDVASAMHKTKQAALERGEKLNQLSLRTERMKDSAMDFAASTQMIHHKYKEKSSRLI